MGVNAQVSALKEHIEHLFPGTWLKDGKSSGKCLRTGLSEIDKCLTKGVRRQRIAEWVGPQSSGKTTILRSAVKSWCASGMNVLYIDTRGELVASDWAEIAESYPESKLWFIRPPACSPSNTETQKGTSQKSSNETNSNKKKYVLRHPRNSKPAEHFFGLKERNRTFSMWYYDSPDEIRIKPEKKDSNQNQNQNQKPSPSSDSNQRTNTTSSTNTSRDFKNSYFTINNYVWTVEKFLRSQLFDVIIIDLGASYYLSNQNHVRLQRSLSRSKSALLIVKSPSKAFNSTGCDARLTFNWETTSSDHDQKNSFEQLGHAKKITITPKINCLISKNGLSKNVEVRTMPYVQNCLFTHSQIPDRRSR